MENKKYQIALFGKKDCDKCASLKKRVLKTLARDEFAAFQMDYFDVETHQGLKELAKAETVTSSRIPTIQIRKYDETSESYVKIRDPRPERREDERLLVPTNLQIETDYSNIKKATIKPENIEEILNLAMNGKQ